MFVTGRPSLFYFGRYWNFIPSLLEEHGYEVLELNLGWMSPKRRKSSLSSFLELAEKSNTNYHAVFDITARGEAEWLAAHDTSAIKSTSLMVAEKRLQELGNISSKTGLQVVPINGSARGDASEMSMPDIAKSYLQWAIRLAEKDHLQKPT